MSEVYDMVKMLADAPEEQRKTMVTERLKMIAGQPEEQRVQGVKGIVLAGAKLPKKKMMGFIKTRTEAMAELPPDSKGPIMVARVKAGKDLPEDVNMQDMKLIMMTISEWPPEKAKMFKENLAKVFSDLGMKMPEMKAEKAEEKPKKKSRWSFR
ncbi:MAG: hypothetical protein ACXAEB_14105 [Candidatus Thorarchaeota archaeon]|jgi:hypothetical protein